MSFRKNTNKKRTLKKLIHLQGGADVANEVWQDAIKSRINYFGETEEIGRFVKPTHPSYSHLNDLIERKEKRLVFSDCHGMVNSEPDFKTVPKNVILCFLAPMGDLNMESIKVPKLKNFIQRLITIKPDEFNNIFKYRSKLREIPMKLDYSDNDALAKYNCFLNSVWYYPGQIYTDHTLRIDRSDIENIKEEIYFNTFNFSLVPGNKKVIFYPNPYIFQNVKPPGLSIRGALASGVPYLKDTLSNFLNKFEKDTGHINLVIMNCCRNISTQYIDNYNLIYENEIAHYHYNLLLDKQKLPSIKGQIFKPSCYSVSYKYVVIDLVLMSDTTMFSQDLDPFHSYNGKIPSLQLLFEDSKKVDKHKLRYLLHMPLKKILLFLVRTPGIKKEKIVDILVKNYYFIIIITRLFEKLVQLNNKIYFIQNNIAETELQNLLQFIKILLPELNKKRGTYGFRAGKFLNLKTKIYEALGQFSEFRKTYPIKVVNEILTLDTYATLPPEKIDLLIAKDGCISLNIGPEKYSNVKEIQVLDSQGFRYGLNLFDKFPVLEKLSFHIYKELESGIKIRNVNLLSLQIQGYHRTNNLNLNLETLQLQGLFLINFNIQRLLIENTYCKNLTDLDLVDCKCSNKEVGKSLDLIFPNIHNLKLVNVMFSPGVTINDLLTQGKFKNVRELYLENLAVDIPNLLIHIEKMPKLGMLSIIGNTQKTLPSTETLDPQQKIMFDLIQKKNSFTMDEVESELSKIDIEI